MKCLALLRSGECIEARVHGELASSAAIVPGREDKGKGVYIRRFSMYLPHAIALRASLAPGTLAFDDRFTVCSNNSNCIYTHIFNLFESIEHVLCFDSLECMSNTCI